MHIASIGVDLGKTTFHRVALGEQGKVVVRKKFWRKQLLAYTANLQILLIGIEACSGAHFIGAVLGSQGHDVRLIPAQFVKPYRKSNKNDFRDAEAIAEAVARPNMRFVPIKTEDQLDLQALHRVRDRLVHRLARPVHDLYFEPRYDEFGSRTIWSLSNAFTSAFKELEPIPQFKATAKLGEFLETRFSQSF